MNLRRISIPVFILVVVLLLLVMVPVVPRSFYYPANCGYSIDAITVGCLDHVTRDHPEWVQGYASITFVLFGDGYVYIDNGSYSGSYSWGPPPYS
jgi:hypothetical protein